MKVKLLQQEDLDQTLVSDLLATLEANGYANDEFSICGLRDHSGITVSFTLASDEEKMEKLAKTINEKSQLNANYDFKIDCDVFVQR